jgi:hypothetical protein
LRASLRAVYGIDLRDARESMRALDLADLVVWLPAGCAFWMAVGGPAAISNETRELRRVGFWLRVLDFRERGSKGEKPKPDPDPDYAHEKREQASEMDRKAQAFLQRQQRRG